MSAPSKQQQENIEPPNVSNNVPRKSQIPLIKSKIGSLPTYIINTITLRDTRNKQNYQDDFLKECADAASKIEKMGGLLVYDEVRRKRADREQRHVHEEHRIHVNKLIH